MGPATNSLEPAIIVLFGITGDLAQRKVLPALYQLFQDGRLHEHTYLVGTSRQNIQKADLIAGLQKTLGDYDQAAIDRLYERLSVLQVDPSQAADYDRLRDHLQAVEESVGTCLHRLFYLSIPPQIFGSVVERLGSSSLNSGCAHGTTSSRLLVEKPFGYDLASAQTLIHDTAQHFSQQQVFRIDHYLAKETAQNILSFRQHNPLFSDIWNNKHISRVSITAVEKIGIEGRANFYEQVGALRDLIQSHLMQLLSLTLMDIPPTLSAEAVHTAKQQVLQSLAAVPAEHVPDQAVRGQYASYRDEVKNPDSTTETYASVVLYSTDPDWYGVPLRLTTGKALKMKRTSITVDFDNAGADPNRLQFRIQPDEGITLTLQVKKPGLDGAVEQTSMNFTYQTAFGDHVAHDAYERVLVEAIRGDHLLFATDEEVLQSWRVLQPLIDAWSADSSDLEHYPSGSDGPDTTKLTTLHHDR